MPSEKFCLFKCVSLIFTVLILFVFDALADYKLPYPIGTKYACQQGNNTEFSHKDVAKYAWDFGGRNGGAGIGDPVVAARSGKIHLINEDFPDDGSINKNPNTANFIVINHGDGTYALYLHLQQNSVPVSVNDFVQQGQRIGNIGLSGMTTGPHLHFQVQNSGASWWKQSIPISFSDQDTAKDNGLPQTGEWYTSSNGVKSTIIEVKLMTPLQMTPAAPTYYVDDTIRANFEIDNQGLKTIALKQVLVGGHGPGGDNDVQDFSSAMNVIIKPISCYQYQGTLKLTKPGKYHFFCAYQDAEKKWNSSIDLGPGLTDADRIQDIEVNQLTTSTSFKAGDKVKVESQLGLWLRSSPEIIDEGPTNKIILKPMPPGTELIIINHSDNGLASDGHYWWWVQYKEQQGWCAEADYRRTDVFLSLIPVVVPLGKPSQPQHTDS